jgi:hypothetical protein
MKTTLLAATLALLSLTAIATQAQDINSWTPQSLKARFGELTHVKSVGGNIKTITFGPLNHFHGPQCMDLILEVLRGTSYAPNPKVQIPDLEETNDDSIWVDKKTNVTINQLQGFVFVAVKSTDVTKPAFSDGLVVLTAHLVDDSDGEWFVVEVL